MKIMPGCASLEICEFGDFEKNKKQQTFKLAENCCLPVLDKKQQVFYSLLHKKNSHYGP